MGGANSWRPQIDFADWVRSTDKRMLNEERRPLITRSQQLLGPGASPRAVQVWDWSSEETSFVGVYYSDPDDGQVNSPDNTAAWMGETFGTADGAGYMRLVEIYLNATTANADGWPAITPRRYQRHFYTPSEVRIFSNWIVI